MSPSPIRLPNMALQTAMGPDPNEVLLRVPPDPQFGINLPPLGASRIESFPDPRVKPGAWVGPEPMQARIGQEYASEVPTQTAPPGFWQQVLEGAANVIGGTQLQPGPGGTFKTAGLPILGLLASQLLTAPIRRGQAERERVNQFLEEEAANRRSEGMERRKAGRDAWAKLIQDTRQAAIDEKATAADRGFRAGESQKDRDAAMARLIAEQRGRTTQPGKGVHRITKEDLRIPGFGQLKEGQEIPEETYLSVLTRAPSESAKAASRFGVRAAAALVPLEKPGDGGALEDRIVAGGNKVLLGLKGPRLAMSTEQKLYHDSRLAWTLAALREESKANITSSEYENVNQAFFAQPGDNADTIANKREMRRVAQQQLEALGEGAGRPPIVEQALAAGGPAAPAAPVKTKIVNGKIVRVS